MKIEPHAEHGWKYQVSPLIDIIFLLIIYFMVTTSLIRKEADLGFSLPSPDFTIDMNLPVDVQVEIVADGSVTVEGVQFPGEDRALTALSRQLAGLKKVADLQRSKLSVTIIPHRETLHRRVIDVMDACRSGGVEHLGFGKSF
jgi:biopolymer transport protein ExbD